MTSDQLVAVPETALPALRGAVAGLPSYVPGRRSAGPDIAALASNESHYDPLPAAVAAVAEAAGRMNRYPDVAAVELRERLARHLAVTAEEVAVGPGSVGVLQQIITGLCDAGDEVVLAWRSFEAYPILVELAGARPVRIPLDDAEGHDLDAMAAAVTARTKVILLCTPNNPTGVPISHERIEAFLRSVRSDILVVIDEAYVEYAVAAPDIAEGLRRTALPFSVSALAQKAAIASLDAGEEMEARVTAVKQERARMAAQLEAQGWKLQASQGNFLWIRADEMLQARLVAALDRAGILVRAYQGDGVRITVAGPASNDRVLRVLEAHAA